MAIIQLERIGKAMDSMGRRLAAVSAKGADDGREDQ
jgi:hypothetical protein